MSLSPVASNIVFSLSKSYAVFSFESFFRDKRTYLLTRATSMSRLSINPWLSNWHNQHQQLNLWWEQWVAEYIKLTALPNEGSNKILEFFWKQFEQTDSILLTSYPWFWTFCHVIIHNLWTIMNHMIWFIVMMSAICTVKIIPGLLQ